VEFTADRNLLSEAVTNAASGVPTSPVQPVRAGMNIQLHDNFVYFVGSDGDTSFASFCEVSRSCGNASLTLPGRLFTEIIKSLPGQDVTISGNMGETTTITCGRAVFKLQAYRDLYPTVVQGGETPGTLLADDFSKAIQATASAASKKDSNPALHGLLLDSDPNERTLTLAATDRYRVAVFEVGWDITGLGSCVIPTWAAERFRRGITTDEVFIGWDDNQCTMKSANFALTTRRIAGTFADWRRFLPTEPPDVTVNVEGLTGAVKRAQLAADADNPVELTFTMGAVRVSAGDSTRAEETVDAAYDGGEFTALFGVSMLLDGLNGCEEENVALGFTEPLKPVHLSSGRFRYTILPRRRI
jgi:DNA polymerase-3 subunit beta